MSFLMLKDADSPELPSLSPSIRWFPIGSHRALTRFGWRLRAVLKMRSGLKRVAGGGRIDAILIVGRDPILIEAGIRAARKAQIPALHEVNEYPDVVAPSGLAALLARFVYSRRQLGRMDGILVISRALETYVLERANVPVLSFGSVVDVEVNDVLPPIHLNEELIIGYAGSISQAKDGVRTLIEAFTAARGLSANRNFRLDIIGGDLESADGRALLEDTRVMGVADHVRFYGQVPQAEVRELLAACHLLVLARPISRQALGGFPTKLGEYLATGRPVVTTAVGDIPRFLRDRVSCFMVPPNDAAALARAFIEVSERYSAAQTIGLDGRAMVTSLFSAEAQAGNLADFVRDLQRGRK